MVNRVYGFSLFKKEIFIGLGLFFLFVTAIGDSVYRDWIYSNNYSDFGLANYFPSITGTLTALFILCGLSKHFPDDLKISSLWVSIGCLLYEGLQPVLGTGIFDWQDILAIIITGLIFQIILKIIHHTQQ